MNKEQLKAMFNRAKAESKDIALEFLIPTKKDTEIRITKNSNLDYILSYYIKEYNENLEYIKCTDIKILSAYPINWGKLKEI